MKKKCAGSWNGLLPIFQSCSRYSRLYHDAGASQGAIRPSRRAGASSRALRHGWPAPKGERCTRPSHSVSRYKILFCDRGQRDRLRHDAIARACVLRHSAVCAAWDSESRYNFCIATGGLRYGAIAPACAWRHGRRGATIRHPVRHDTAPSAWRASGLGLGCAHCSPNLVLTQCTVYSHCLDHCS